MIGVRAPFAGGGEMGLAMSRVDWAASSLGPVEGWPQSLRTAVDLCLASRAPMMVVWGPEQVQLYNDALAPLMGPKHPAALGRPYAESFPEIWDDVMRPMLTGIYERGESSYLEDLPVSFHRQVPDQEMFWTFSWSPIRDEQGRVAGALHPAVETTDRVLAARRSNLLRDLAASTGQAATVEDAYQRAVDVFDVHRVDVPLSAVYLIDEPAGAGVRQVARRVATSGVADVSQVFPPEVDLTAATFTAWPLSAAATSGQTQVLCDLGVSSDWLDAAPGEPTPTTGVVVPMSGPGRAEPVALLAVGLNPRRPLDEGQVGFLQMVAGQLATSLATAALHEQQQRVALALQRAMLPDTAPSYGLLDVAARYVAGASDVEVGGDWYDVVPLGAGRTALIIGDVMGRGVQAAAVMGQLRAAVRAYAQLDLPPERVLDLLGRLVEHISEARDVGQIVTCVYAVHDAGDGTLTAASAGHPPAVLFSRTSCTTWLGPTGPPLGTGYTGYQAGTVPFGGEDGVLLYTDGLIERRDSDIDVGIERLLSAVAGSAPEDLERLADAALAITAGGSLADDVALLAVRLRPEDHPLPPALVVDLTAEGRVAQRARHAAAAALAEWGVGGETAYHAVLLAAELVNNAVTHTSRPRQLRLRHLTDRVVVEVGDFDFGLPRQQDADLTCEGGRGLLILDALASSWGVRYDGTGKVVWCEVPLAG